MNPRQLSTNTGGPHKAALSLVFAITLVTFAVANYADGDGPTPNGDKDHIDPKQFRVRQRIKLDVIPRITVSGKDFPFLDSFKSHEVDSAEPFVYSPMGKEKPPPPELVLDTESPLHEPWLRSEETYQIPIEELMDKMKEGMRKQMEQEAQEKKNRHRLRYPKIWNPFAKSKPKSKPKPSTRVPSFGGVLDLEHEIRQTWRHADDGSAQSTEHSILFVVQHESYAVPAAVRDTNES